jgi:hypothetical protein
VRQNEPDFLMLEYITIAKPPAPGWPSPSAAPSKRPAFFSEPASSTPPVK